MSRSAKTRRKRESGCTCWLCETPKRTLARWKDRRRTGQRKRFAEEKAQ